MKLLSMIIGQQGILLYTTKIAVFLVLGTALLPSMSRAQAPVLEITPIESSMNFEVDASVSIKGKFDKWDGGLKFTSTDLATGVLDIKIQADSVNTGSGTKNSKLKSKDFFNVKENPYITFKSTKIVQTGPMTFDVPGTFTIRGVSKPETLNLDLFGDRAKGEGQIKGTMAFDRKQYGMNSGIPFIKIADRVEVTVNLKVKRVSGRPLDLKQ